MEISPEYQPEISLEYQPGIRLKFKTGLNRSIPSHNYLLPDFKMRILKLIKYVIVGVVCCIQRLIMFVLGQ